MKCEECTNSGEEASRAGTIGISGPNSVCCSCGPLSLVLSDVHVSGAGLLSGICLRISAPWCAGSHMFRWTGAVEAQCCGALQALLQPSRGREEHTPREMKVTPHHALVQCGHCHSSVLVWLSVGRWSALRNGGLSRSSLCSSSGPLRSARPFPHMVTVLAWCAGVRAADAGSLELSTSILGGALQADGHGDMLCGRRLRIFALSEYPPHWRVLFPRCVM